MSLVLIVALATPQTILAQTAPQGVLAAHPTRR
jgi:hypothetical protein